MPEPEGIKAPPSAATPSPKPVFSAPAPQSTPQSDVELKRVREIILGNEANPHLQGAEADRLRDILFGAQMEEYDRRFADTRREVERVVTDVRQMQDRLGEFEKSQSKRLEQLELETRRVLDDFRRDVSRLTARDSVLSQLQNRVQQHELADQGLAERARQAQDSLTQQERELRALKAALTEYREQFERKLDTLKREERQAEDDLRAELRRVTNRLSDQKTDRKALAAMLMEVAARLETGATMTGLLEDLTRTVKE